MRVDNISAEPVAPELGIHPLGMEAVMLPALAGFRPDRALRPGMRSHR
jgi:NADH dehydrogenase